MRAYGGGSRELLDSIGLGRPILFAGSQASDTWRMLGDAGWLVPEQTDGIYNVADINNCLNCIADDNERAAKSVAAVELNGVLKEQRRLSYQRIADQLQKLAAESG